MNKFSEEEIENIKNGDLSPLNKLYLEHYEFWTGSLVKFDNCDKDMASNVTMDAILVLMDKINQGNFKNENVKSFVLTVAKNLWKNFSKRDRKSLPFEPEKVEAYLNDNKTSTQLGEGQQRKVDAALQAIKHIGDGCEKLMKQNIYEGIPLRELMKDLGYKNYDVIKSAKSRCLKKLKELVHLILNKNPCNG